MTEVRINWEFNLRKVNLTSLLRKFSIELQQYKFPPEVNESQIVIQKPVTKSASHCLYIASHF